MATHYTITTANQPGAVGIVQVSGEADAIVGMLDALCDWNSRQHPSPTGGGGRRSRSEGALGQKMPPSHAPTVLPVPAARDQPSRGEGGANTTATPSAAWPVGRLRLCDFAGIDEGLAGLISPTTAQLMPHGGPRVMQKLVAWLRDHGVPPAPGTASEFPGGLFHTQSRYPEAASPIEADVLHAIATAASPAAIDRLAAQPKLWRDWFSADPKSEIRNPKPLHHLLHPPTVVVVGRPNVGKSTLLNQLLGRSASVVADLPGTTRDWVGGLVELCPTTSGGGVGAGGDSGGGDPLRDAVAVRWLDTPGIRTSNDAVEQRAIELARSLMDSAQVLISMTGADTPWLDASEVPREPDLELYNQFASAPPPKPTGRVVVNAATGEGIDRLTTQVLEHLGLAQISAGADEPWAFSPTLQNWAAGEDVDLAGYLAG